MLPEKVSIVEVGPRDGLQNESQILSLKQKVNLINSLSKTGLKYIELGAFVHPGWIPQMANTEEVSKSINRSPNLSYGALVPNLKGLDRAINANMDEIAIFLSVSQTHNLKNTNRSIEESLSVYGDVIKKAQAKNIKVRGYLSTVFGCPYEGKIDVKDTLPLIRKLIDSGVYQVSLGDTIGTANPNLVEEILTPVKKEFSLEKIALHYHDTRGTALVNVFKSLQMGFNTFDSAIGGLGGCPYAPGASGNVSTEDLVNLLHELNIKTGVDLDALVKINQYLQGILDRKLSSKFALAYIGEKIKNNL